MIKVLVVTIISTLIFFGTRAVAYDYLEDQVKQARVAEMKDLAAKNQGYEMIMRGREPLDLSDAHERATRYAVGAVVVFLLYAVSALSKQKETK
ncbi:MAG TPA: hypothetical protein VNR20_03330 [Terriglobales bacterium]|nr:hypothetical protein [Terriglobales bacterium]